MNTPGKRLHWRRALLATTAALSLGAQNAWAVCSDGTTLPNDGFVVGRDPQVLTAANWSANVFTAPAGSIFIPDNSVNELNNPATAPDRWRPQLGVRPGLDALQGDRHRRHPAPWPPAGRSRRTPRPIASCCRSSRAAGSSTSATSRSRARRSRRPAIRPC